ncbi:electron transfer DM13-domain-containing protein, partial [Chytridium lagenaria]
PFVANPSSGHTVTGSITIVDDCTFNITGFTLTPAGPDVYFWGASAGTRSELLASGRRVSDFKVSGEYATPTDLSVKLINGQTFDNINVVSVWCEMFKADFGQSSLVAQTIPPTTTGSVALTTAAPAAPATSTTKSSATGLDRVSAWISVFAAVVAVAAY